MREIMVDDELWELIPATPTTTKAALPLSGSQGARRSPGAERHPHPVRALDRNRLTAAAAGARLCSGMTGWRRPRDWQQAGVFERLHQLLLAKLRYAEQLDFSPAVCESATPRALLGTARPGRVRLTGPRQARSTT
jgi:hypothetical protein